MKQLHDYTGKPYYRCLSCPKFRILCGGMPTRGMDLKEWCEYIRDVMDYFNLSVTYVSERSDVSQRKMASIHAINVEQDIMRSTARRIEQVVLGSATHFMCDMDAGNAAEKIAYLETQIEHLLKENHRYAKIIDKYLA